MKFLLENFVPDKFLGFCPKRWKKAGSVQTVSADVKEQFKSCFGCTEFSWPSREGCKVRYVLTGVSDCRAGWDLAAFTLRHMLLKPFPVPAYKICCKTFVHRKKKNLVRVCCYKSLWNNHFEQGRQTRETNGSTATGNGAAVSRTL